MVHILVRHQVEDYGKWKAAFDTDESVRKAGGGAGHQLFRGADNPNEITILLEWDDLAKAQAFTSSPELKETMQKAGVLVPPDISFINQAG